MTTQTQKPAAPKAETEKKAAALAPLKALHTIDGGDDHAGASPGTFFVPRTETERKELLDLEAAAEIDDAGEKALVEKTGARTLGQTLEQFAEANLGL